MLQPFNNKSKPYNNTMKLILIPILFASPLLAQYSSDPSDPVNFNLELAMLDVQHKVWPMISSGDEANACEIVIEWRELTFVEWLVSNFPRAIQIPSGFTCWWGATVTGSNGLTQYGEPEWMWGVIEHMGLDWDREFARALQSFRFGRDQAVNRSMVIDLNVIRGWWTSPSSYANDWIQNGENQLVYNIDEILTTTSWPGYWLDYLARAHDVIDPNRSTFSSLELAYTQWLDGGEYTQDWIAGLDPVDIRYGESPRNTLGDLTARTADAWNVDKQRVGDPAQPFGLSVDADVWADGSVPFILNNALDRLRSCQ